MILGPRPLTAEAFRPFGDVIDIDSASRHFTINDGFAERYHDLANLDLSEEDGKPIVSIFRAQPRALPLEIAMMECHPRSSQAFVPLHAQDFLVVVAAAGSAPQDVVCFHAVKGQGVNFARGTWHHPLIALQRTSNFLVIDRAGPGENCTEHHFAEGAYQVVLPS